MVNGQMGLLLSNGKVDESSYRDATCPDTFAPSHITLATREAGTVANEAEWREKQ